MNVKVKTQLCNNMSSPQSPSIESPSQMHNTVVRHKYKNVCYGFIDVRHIAQSIPHIFGTKGRNLIDIKAVTHAYHIWFDVSNDIVQIWAPSELAVCATITELLRTFVLYSTSTSTNSV